MGCEHCAMPDALPVHLVTVAGFWMDRTPVTNFEFERFVRETGYITVAERPLDPEEVLRSPAREARAGLRGVHPHFVSRPARRSPSVVALHARRELEAPARREVEPEGSAQPSGGPSRLRRRGGVCAVGEEAVANRSRVRVCRTRWSRPGALRVGQRDDAGRKGRGKHVARAVSSRGPRRRWIPRNVTGDRVPTKWIWPVPTSAATSGNGAPTGIGRIPTQSARNRRPRSPIRRVRWTASTPKNPARSSAWFAAARTSAPIRYLCAISRRQPRQRRSHQRDVQRGFPFGAGSRSGHAGSTPPVK